MDNIKLRELIRHKNLVFELHDKDEKVLRELKRRMPIIDFDEYIESDLENKKAEEEN